MGIRSCCKLTHSGAPGKLCVFKRPWGLTKQLKLLHPLGGHPCTNHGPGRSRGPGAHCPCPVCRTLAVPQQSLEGTWCPSEMAKTQQGGSPSPRMQTSFKPWTLFSSASRMFQKVLPNDWSWHIGREPAPQRGPGSLVSSQQDTPPPPKYIASPTGWGSWGLSHEAIYFFKQKLLTYRKNVWCTRHPTSAAQSWPGFFRYLSVLSSSQVVWKETGIYHLFSKYCGGHP